VCCPSDPGKFIKSYVVSLPLHFAIDILWNCDASNISTIKCLCTNFKVVRNYGMVQVCVFTTWNFIVSNIYKYTWADGTFGDKNIFVDLIQQFQTLFRSNIAFLSLLIEAF